MKIELKKQAHYLKIYIVVATLICCVFLLTDLSLQNRKISIDCITFSEKNGKMTVILTVPSGSMTDAEETVTKTVEVRYPGMLFYN